MSVLEWNGSVRQGVLGGVRSSSVGLRQVVFGMVFGARLVVVLLGLDRHGLVWLGFLGWVRSGVERLSLVL